MSERDRPFAPWEDDDRSLRDPRLLGIGVALTLLVHAAIAFAFARFDEPVKPVEGTINRGLPLCAEGHRCPAVGWHRPRMGIETSLPGDIEIIQAAVIPKLGMKEQDPKKLPELQQYEQPEKGEEAINIEEKPPKPEEKMKFKEFKPKKAKLDRRRKKKRDLSSILAEDDPDPRRRHTRLEDIIGNPEGDARGTGTEFVPGSEWAGKVTLAMRREFVVPASIDDDTLRGLSVEIAILKISKDGEIQRYDVVRRSRNGAYNTAAVQLIKRFMPSEGGMLTLPEPPADVRRYINSQGMIVVLEGRLFRR